VKYVEVIADSGSPDSVSAIAEKFKVRDFRRGAIVTECGQDRIQVLG